MEITAAQVKELREKTGVGMMQCKKALQESEGDMNAAIEVLRKKGQETAAKRAGRAANQGKVMTRINTDNACMVEINCETDFVARNTDFISFGEHILELLSAENCETVESLKEKKLSSGLTVQEGLMELIGKIGENLSIRGFNRIDFDPAKAKAFSYIHGGGKIGVLLLVEADNGDALGNDAFEQLGKDLTLQIAAANPQGINREDIDGTLIEKEKEIYKTQALNEGKPEKILDRIIEGKMNKYYATACLLEQPFVKNADQTINQVIAETGKAVSANITVKSFTRFLLGGENN